MPRILNPVAPELTNISPRASSAWVGPANSRCIAPNAVAGPVTGRYTAAVYGALPVANRCVFRK